MFLSTSAFGEHTIIGVINGVLNGVLQPFIAKVGSSRPI
jgi:hypothetical protein